jgi:hypothetical protein
MNRNVLVSTSATVAVIVVLVLGFRFLGSPARQHLVRGDSRTVQALAGIAQQINYAWNQSQALPANLGKISGIVTRDPVSGKPFLYRPKQNSEYELCATFGLDNRRLPDTNTADPWLHPRGDYCFAWDASQPVPAVTFPYSYY